MRDVVAVPGVVRPSRFRSAHRSSPARGPPRRIGRSGCRRRDCSRGNDCARISITWRTCSSIPRSRCRPPDCRPSRSGEARSKPGWRGCSAGRNAARGRAARRHAPAARPIRASDCGSCRKSRSRRPGPPAPAGWRGRWQPADLQVPQRHADGPFEEDADARGLERLDVADAPGPTSVAPLPSRTT